VRAPATHATERRARLEEARAAWAGAAAGRETALTPWLHLHAVRAAFIGWKGSTTAEWIEFMNSDVYALAVDAVVLEIMNTWDEDVLEAIPPQQLQDAVRPHPSRSQYVEDLDRVGGPAPSACTCCGADVEEAAPVDGEQGFAVWLCSVCGWRSMVMRASE
jgi:hypothetical protein